MLAVCSYDYAAMSPDDRSVEPGASRSTALESN